MPHHRTVTVYLPSGHAVVTGGETVFEAARNAMNFFNDPFWKGPKPKPHEVLKLIAVGDVREWRVKVGRVS